MCEEKVKERVEKRSVVQKKNITKLHSDKGGTLSPLDLILVTLSCVVVGLAPSYIHFVMSVMVRQSCYSKEDHI